MNPCGQTSRMSKPSAARYRTTNRSSYSASLCRRGSLLIWLDKDMIWLAPPDGSSGRPAVFSERRGSENSPGDCFPDESDPILSDDQGSVQAAAQANDRDDVQLGSKLADLDWAVPDHTPRFRRQSAIDRIPRPKPDQAKMRCLKAFGERIAAVRQTAEIQITRHSQALPNAWRSPAH